LKKYFINLGATVLQDGYVVIFDGTTSLPS